MDYKDFIVAVVDYLIDYEGFTYRTACDLIDDNSSHVRAEWVNEANAHTVGYYLVGA